MFLQGKICVLSCFVFCLTKKLFIKVSMVCAAHIILGIFLLQGKVLCIGTHRSDLFVLKTLSKSCISGSTVLDTNQSFKVH